MAVKFYMPTHAVCVQVMGGDLCQ